MAKTPEVISDVPAITEQVSDKVLKALQRAGVNPTEVSVPDVALAVPTTLEDLCDRDSTFPRAKESPLLIVTKPIDIFPEVDKFETYVGYIRVECVTDEAEHIAFSHYYARKETGELAPLTEWLLAQTPPFAFKCARIETNTKGRHIIRPIPL